MSIKNADQRLLQEPLLWLNRNLQETPRMNFKNQHLLTTKTPISKMGLHARKIGPLGAQKAPLERRRRGLTCS